MKKLPTVLDTPARVVLAVVTIMLAGKFLMTLLSESIHTTILKDAVLKKWCFELIDPIALIAIVSSALYRLIFRLMTARQAELERRHDELCCIQKVAVGRELRMKELAKEISTLRIRLPSKKPTIVNSRPVLWKSRTLRQSNPAPSR